MKREPKGPPAFRNHFGVVQNKSGMNCVKCPCHFLPWPVVGDIPWFVKKGDRVMFHLAVLGLGHGARIHALESSVSPKGKRMRCDD